MWHKNLFLIFALMISAKIGAQVIDTIYDDKNNDPATSVKFHHYHVLEIENDLIKMTGFRKSGGKFMEGLFKDSLSQEKTGAFFYYKRNKLSETELYEINKYPDIQEKYKDIISHYPAISDSQSIGIKYYKNGKIKYFGLFENCQLEKIWYYFTKKGDLSYSVTYHNGIADGVAIFYNNKVPQIIGTYKNGKRDGEWRYYDENCKLTKTVRYVNGKKNEVFSP